MLKRVHDHRMDLSVWKEEAEQGWGWDKDERCWTVQRNDNSLCVLSCLFSVGSRDVKKIESIGEQTSIERKKREVEIPDALQT